MTIDHQFLMTGEQWGSLNMQYSFLSTLPGYYALAAVHFTDFALGTESQISSNSSSSAWDQQDIVRFILDDPAALAVYSGSATVNSILVNTANTSVPGGVENFRVSFSDVITASFSEDALGGGDIVVMNQDAYSSSDPSKGYIPTSVNQGIGIAGDVFINSLDTDALSDLTPGGYGFWLLLHELGHAVGGLEDVRNTAEQNSYVDYQKYTIMSDRTYGGVYASGLQILDIAALQDAYGTTNTSTRAGDTTYALGQGLGFYGATANDAFLYTIWDGGGTADTIDASGFNVRAEIDLREGRFSSIGKDASGVAWADDSLALTGVDPDPGNVAIAYGTVIENAIGTILIDHIIGNDADNTIQGKAGNDAIEGGAGSDTYLFSYGDNRDTITDASGTTDVIKMGAGITSSNITFSYSGNNLIINFTGHSAGRITIVDHNSTSGLGKIEKIVFDNLSELSISGTNVINGTNSADTLNGTDWNDIISGSGGSDTLRGLNGNDTLNGDAGLDKLIGGDGNDILNGGSTAEQDTLNGGYGDDECYGGNGGDIFFTSPGQDIMDGSGTSQDVDSITADDLSVTNLQNGMIPVNHGIVVNLSLSLGQVVDDGFGFTETVVSIENVTGSSYADILTAWNPALAGAQGSQLAGKGGNDTLNGGIGQDSLFGEADNDTLSGAGGNDTLNGGTGNDILYGGAGTDALSGGADADTFVFEAASAFSNQDTIADFSAANADKIDLHDILDMAFDPLTDAISDFVNFTNSGANSVMQIDRDGTGATYGWANVATLTGLTNQDETTLYNNGNLLVA